MTVLRPYQVDAIAAVQRELIARRSTLLVLATGLGKTVCFAELARVAAAAGERTLVIAHREELIAQAVEKLSAAGVVAGVEQGRHRAGDEMVVVASPQTLRGDRLAAWPRNAFRRIVLDEAHHANASTWRSIVDHFSEAKVLGVTATPHRADGKPLGDVFESLAYRYELRAAIRDQWLVPITARRIVVEGIDIASVRTRAGDLDREELAAVMEQERAVSGVVAPLLAQAGDRRTLVFASSVAHARALAAAINRQRPGAAAVGHGEMDEDERKAVLAAFRSGACQYLINVQLWTEGFDEPSVQCIAMVRPTKSLALMMQMLGRGTRLLGPTYAESVANGKRDVLVIDFTGEVGRHRLCGAIDVLLGDMTLVPEDVRTALEKRLEDGAADLDEAYRLAHGDAVVRWRSQEIDLFIGEDDSGPLADGAWSEEPPSRHVLAALKKHGVKVERLPASVRAAEAERLLSRLDMRKRAGLATLGQARRIAISGIPTAKLARQRADALILKLKAWGWKPQALAGEPEYLEARRSRAMERAA